MTLGVDQAAVRRGEGVHLDSRLVVRAVEISLAAHGSGLHLVAPSDVEATGPSEVRVTVVGRVDFAFVGAVPGVARSGIVRASASATVVG